MKTILLTLTLLCSLTLPSLANSQGWCPILMRHAGKILWDQTDDDLEGQIRVRAGVPRRDHDLYKELIHEARKLLVMHHETMEIPEMLEQIGQACEEWQLDKAAARQK